MATRGRQRSPREFLRNAGQASAADMLALIADVRERVQQAYGVTLENEVVVWKRVKTHPTQRVRRGGRAGILRPIW